MADLKQKAAAKKFVAEWTGRGQEDEDSHKFWLSLMQNVLGIEDALTCIDFEKKVKLKGEPAPKRIDGYIARSKVLIEQKSLEIDLDKPQVGHNGQTPFEQAKFYNDNLNLDDKARWIIVSNFREIRIYNMNYVLADPLVIQLYLHFVNWVRGDINSNIQILLKFYCFLLTLEKKCAII